MDFNKDKSFTQVQVDALSEALDEDAQKSERLRKRGEGCMTFFAPGFGHLWNGWMLMFVVALLGFPLGYWPCVLIAYTVSSIFGIGNWNLAINVAKIQKRFEK